ncbi:hypothetical protein Poli38472_007971 [Pythium oligandrum]|uniref:HTH CENPB-type domain-containing protein n=1 Tax=Pythium oligandrum TaxID=41045 RepID=A0A8K1CLM6_PYTOL|nr:hypothetical protein Poli38472_007971 [Pythium oligandrum]|eukprot:TMW65329.1 hypothetical protein Poli38472_007971 [Pythium oligandrum]
MGQKGTGRRLSDQERMEIISKLEGDKPRASAAECARQYGVSSAAITKLMKMKDKIKQRFKENNAFSQQRKRGGTERHAVFEDELFEWINRQQAATGATQLSAAKIQEKAQELLKAHDLGSFRASKGWYYRFCRRYGLSRSSFGGDEVDQDDTMLGHSESEVDDPDTEEKLEVADHVASPALKPDEDDADKLTKKKRPHDATPKKLKQSSSRTWAGIESLQDTLARAANALDHPGARDYLGENAANEMLRSIQQSIGVVQCIRLKKLTGETPLTPAPSSPPTDVVV